MKPGGPLAQALGQARALEAPELEAPGLDSRPLRESTPAVESAAVESAAVESAPPAESTAVESAAMAAASTSPSSAAHGDVDEIMHMLEGHGMVERSTDRTKEWVPKKQARGERQRVGLSMVAVWVLGIAAVAGAFYGYQRYLAHRHAKGADEYARARALIDRGDHTDLVQAEVLLRKAYELDPRNARYVDALLMGLSQRSLEGGAVEASALRPIIRRATKMKVASAHVDTATALVALEEGRLTDAQAALKRAAQVQQDAPVRYMVGRLFQRLGRTMPLGTCAARMGSSDSGRPLRWRLRKSMPALANLSVRPP